METITKTRLYKPDLVIMDVLMPKMNGIVACRMLKKDARTKDIPIMIFTVSSESDDVKKGIEAGAVDYIVKPCNYDELLKKIHKVIGPPEEKGKG
jgi:DNA-binding response OmpR family regulator